MAPKKTGKSTGGGKKGTGGNGKKGGRVSKRVAEKDGEPKGEPKDEPVVNNGGKPNKAGKKVAKEEKNADDKPPAPPGGGRNLRPRRGQQAGEGQNAADKVKDGRVTKPKAKKPAAEAKGTRAGASSKGKKPSPPKKTPTPPPGTPPSPPAKSPTPPKKTPSPPPPAGSPKTPGSKPTTPTGKKPSPDKPSHGKGALPSPSKSRSRTPPPRSSKRRARSWPQDKHYLDDLVNSFMKTTARRLNDKAFAGIWKGKPLPKKPSSSRQGGAGKGTDGAEKPKSPTKPGNGTPPKKPSQEGSKGPGKDGSKSPGKEGSKEPDDDKDDDEDPPDPDFDPNDPNVVRPPYRHIIPQHRKRAPWETADRRVWKTGSAHGSHYPLAWNGWQDDTASDQPLGIRRKENTCYRLALLQCLFHLPAFYNMLLFKHYACAKPDCLLCATQNLLIAYWHRPSGMDYMPDTSPKVSTIPDGLTPDTAFGYFQRAVKQALKTKTMATKSEFAAGRQADPDSFFNLVLRDGLLADDMRGHSSDNMFWMEIRGEVQCDECGQTNLTPTTRDIQSILLPVSERPESQDIVTRLLDWGNAGEPTRCPGCRTLCTAHNIVETFPDVLMIVLPFSVDGINKWTDEAGNPVKTGFGQTLEFPSELVRGEGTMTRPRVRYRLYGSAIHIGESVGGGHWIATVRARDGDGYYVVNDTHISWTPPSAEQFRRDANPDRVNDQRADAKLLFFQRLEPR